MLRFGFQLNAAIYFLLASTVVGSDLHSMVGTLIASTLVVMARRYC